MEALFRELATGILARIQAGEVLLLYLDGEDSDFVRFNRNAIRQAGHVRQQRLSLSLIDGKRQTTAAFNLCGHLSRDLDQAGSTLRRMREQLPFLPEDPYLQYATVPENTLQRSKNTLPAASDAVTAILDTAQGLDLVGLWSSGEMAHGFANSLGQFNWYCNHSFNFDWSVYQHGDKAVKQNHAGFEWRQKVLDEKIDHARETLPLLSQTARTIEPGRYRVYLTPGAMNELMGLLGWGGFSLKSHRTAQTPLLGMIREGTTLGAQVNLRENHTAGLVPPFTRAGFIKPGQVDLIHAGIYRECLANPRSASEYGLPVNCDIETPQSLEITGGDLPNDGILQALDTGIFISNLWYSNFSDRNHCRITGMTRFASLWVENGRIVAPLNVMRFDETLYNILGENLIALTQDTEHIFDASTYERRSESSSRLPGALVDDFNLTL